MNKHLQHLLLFEKFRIQTRLSGQEIQDHIRDFVDHNPDYYGSISEDGFFVAEANWKNFFGGHTKNSFAPVARAKIREQDGMTSVSVVMSMHPLVAILFAPIYLISLLLLLPFPVMLILLYFAFVKPARKLRETLEDLVTDKE